MYIYVTRSRIYKNAAVDCNSTWNGPVSEQESLDADM